MTIPVSVVIWLFVFMLHVACWTSYIEDRSVGLVGLAIASTVAQWLLYQLICLPARIKEWRVAQTADVEATSPDSPL